MKFNVGDKVSFLNEQGGGIVSKVINENLVHVTIDDGFDIPVVTTNLIKTGTAEMSSEIQKAYQRIYGTQEEEVDEDVLPLYLAHNSPDQRQAGLYFCLVPEIQDNPLTGSLELYLVNHTPYELLFAFYQNHSGAWHGTEYGFLKSESRLFLGTIGRSEIEKWANALLQALFYQDEKASPLAPFSGLINFKPVKIYKEESFQYESFLRKKAFFVEVCKLAELSRKHIFEESLTPENLKSLQEKISSSQRSEASPAARISFLDKHKIDDSIAEVDLHIGELVDNFSNLEKGDLLNLQIEYFTRCMQQAVKEKLNKIIFIHGVGNGKLKTEINKLLEKTEAIEFYDASYARYGMGATEVHFYRNK